MLKVAGGKYRSRQLEVPPNGTVPTKSMVREAIANALLPMIPGARVLDLFAGSGALGIEMLSRGAKEAVFVDHSPEAARIITSNLVLLKETNGKVVCADFRSAIESFDAPFDIVLLDPPYAELSWYDDAVQELLQHNLLKEGSAVMLEYEQEPTLDASSFSRSRSYRYGRTKVTILWR